MFTLCTYIHTQYMYSLLLLLLLFWGPAPAGLLFCTVLLCVLLARVFSRRKRFCL
uniref:Uncharacterized protein n=1 Tax=Amphimedon queenslandica TaxID=400682 RepID=A0A1X7TBN4_AMPQE